MKKILLGLAVCLPLIFISLFWLAFLSERPPLTTDLATLAGDGSTLDYCVKPALDGSGKNAVDIPKGNTPGCSYSHFPLPILAECTEPLPAGTDDIRGLWRAVSGRLQHVERVEQCGSRTVITTAGIIHDYGPNATGGLNTNDTEGQVVFTIGEREYCPRTSASMIWKDNVLNFHIFGWGPKAVSRYREGDQLIWEYADGNVTRMERICTLPDTHKTPKPRGPRISVFE